MSILYLHKGAGIVSIEGLAGLAGLRVLRDVYSHAIIYTVYAHRFYDIGRYRLFIFY
jgi:hypothetical protein